MTAFHYVTLAIALWNIITFALYGADKHKARKNRRRTSERVLIFCAFFMGGIGALLGMSTFRHKTKHLKFRVLVPLAIVVNIGIVIAGLYWLTEIFNRAST